MKQLGRRLFQSKQILSSYSGNVPLISFLKDHFKKNKKFGKRDRSEITEISFAFYRMGLLTKVLPFNECASIGYLISNTIEMDEIAQFNELNKWNLPDSYCNFSLEEKIDVFESSLDIKINEQVFSSNIEFSNGVNSNVFVHQIFKQAPVFIRLLRNRNGIVHELEKLNIPFTEIDEMCIQLRADVKLNLLSTFTSGDFYIQDYASQQTLNEITPKNGEIWWDPCCGAGGKSLLFLQKFPGTKLLSSDVRKSIIENYNTRMTHHGFSNRALTFNLEKPNTQTIKDTFDGIILDVPCSGSGTWRRSPENICNFSAKMLAAYISNQRNLLKNSCSYLKDRGTINYITCSVFKEENEQIIDYALQNLGLKLTKQGIIFNGEVKSDYLFAATLIKVS